MITPAKLEYVWATCQPGMEAALKEEVAREYGDRLHAAYQRPGWVTWKAVGDVWPAAAWSPRTPLAARGWGVSLEQLKVTATGGRVATQVDEALAKWGAKPAEVQVQIWVRPEHTPGEEPPEWVERARVWRAELSHELFSGGWQVVERAATGAVIDLVRLEDDVIFIGSHDAGPGRSSWPGGQFPSELPEGAPSRAALKLEEMLDWSGLTPKAGELALEIGAAPGGACFLLLQRGLRVIGVDPAAMDERILRHSKFRHVARTFSELEREDLKGEAVQWLAVDLNGPGEVALDAVEKILPWMSGSLKGAFITLKIGDFRRLAGMPAWAKRLESLGFKDVRLAQLSQHRQEIGAVATWRK